MLVDLRSSFNASFTAKMYAELLNRLERGARTRVEFRVAETPIFVPLTLLDGLAAAGAELTRRLLDWPEYLDGARASIPEPYRVASETAHPHFLTADFALIQNEAGELTPRLVEIQAFPSVYAYQAMLSRKRIGMIFELPEYAGSLLRQALIRRVFWALMRQDGAGRTCARDTSSWWKLTLCTRKRCRIFC